MKYIAKPINGREGAPIDVTAAGTDEEAKYKLVRAILADTGHPLIARHQNYALFRAGTENSLGTIKEIFRAFRYGNYKQK